MVWQFLSNAPEETIALGNSIARHLVGEMVIALSGPLGAGKTLLTKGIAMANAGEPVEVTSPTFTLVQEYSGCLTIYHLDVYRLAKPNDPILLALEEMVRPGAVAIIEWADRVAPSLHYDTLSVAIQPRGETGRLFAFQATGPKSQRCLEELRVEWFDTPIAHS